MGGHSGRFSIHNYPLRVHWRLVFISTDFHLVQRFRDDAISRKRKILKFPGNGPEISKQKREKSEELGKHKRPMMYFFQ